MTFNFRIKHHSQSGQMLIIMLLIMIVGLTVGLFLVSRTTTDIGVSTKITEATRAFNAAEAGIEEAIRTSAITQGVAVPFASGATYTLNTVDLSGASGSLYPPSKDIATSIGDTFTAWFVSHDAAGNLVIPPPPPPLPSWSYRGNRLDVCYTNSPVNPTGTIPAIMVTVYYRDAAGYIKSAYTGYDSQPGSRIPPNYFRTASNPPATGNGSVCAANYNYWANVDFATDFGNSLNLTANTIALVSIRIRPVYADTYIAVAAVGPGSLPKQGIDIVSTGNVGESTRKIQVKEPYLVPAPFLDSAIYSADPATDITK